MNKLIVGVLSLLVFAMAVGSESVPILNGVPKDYWLIILGGLLTIAGGVATTLLTYKLQSRQQKRQWRMDRMERRFEPLRGYLVTTVQFIRLRHHVEDPDFEGEFHTQRRSRLLQRAKVDSSLAAIGDEDLENLYELLDRSFDDWLRAFEEKDRRKMIECEKAMKGTQGIMGKIHKRMNELEEHRL